MVVVVVIVESQPEEISRLFQEVLIYGRSGKVKVFGHPGKSCIGSVTRRMTSPVDKHPGIYVNTCKRRKGTSWGEGKDVLGK